MKILFLNILSFMIFSIPVIANDRCNGEINFNSLDQSRDIRDQHLVVLHSSVRSIPEPTLVGYLNQFFQELCKMPYVHREVISRHLVEIHLLVGSIAQHDLIKNLLDRGIAPRGHKDDWDKIPGVGGVAGRNDPSGSSPALFNLASLYSNHGSKNLVLHEMGHTLDHFLYRNGSVRRMVSAQSEFQDIINLTPWESVYLTSEKQSLIPVPVVPELDLSPFASSPPSIRAIYEEQSRKFHQESLARQQVILELNRQIEENNRIIERSDREHMAYHQEHEEEHFAELYAGWYDGSESRYRLYTLLPTLNLYFPSLY